MMTMMTKKCFSSIAVTSFLCLASLSVAQESAKDEVEVLGTIVEVSPEASTLTLEETAADAGKAGVVRTFVITESTELSSDGETIELAEIHAGARATVRYVMDYGNAVASSVELDAPATE